MPPAQPVKGKFLGRLTQKNPDLDKRLRAGETVADEELREAGFDPDLLRRYNVRFEEVKNRQAVNQ